MENTVFLAAERLRSRPRISPFFSWDSSTISGCPASLIHAGRKIASFTAAPGELHFHQNRIPGRRAQKLGHQVEDEVPQAVEDQGALVDLDPLQDVGVVADHQPRPGIDRRPPQGHLRPGQGAALAEAPVKGGDHELRLLPGPPDQLRHHLHIIGVDAGGSIERIAPDHGNPGLQRVGAVSQKRLRGEGEEGKAHPTCLEKCRASRQLLRSSRPRHGGYPGESIRSIVSSSASGP